MSNFSEKIADLPSAKLELLDLLLKKKGIKPSLAQPVARRKKTSPCALSFAQQRLWFLDQLAPNNVAYLIPDAIRLTGSLDIRALEKSLTEIARRHETLRTSFTVIDSQPVQVISEPRPFHLPFTDLSDLERSEREQMVHRLAEEEAARPFDLTIAPLLRAHLLRLSDEEHVLLVTMHHIISDGWSMSVLIREVAALYRAFSRDETSPLEELPVQYADYAVWQREWLQGSVLAEQLSYWREQLRGAPGVLELPTDRPRPAVQSNRGGAVKVEIGAETTAGLKELSRKENVTIFMTLLAAFDVLLWRWSGQEDVVVGTPIANRTRAEVEGLIGFFVNTLALRVRVGGNARFDELLRQVKEVCLGAYAHQELPFEKLVEELEPERTMSHSPVFQVLLALQNAPREELLAPGLKLSHVDGKYTTAKFDLSFSLSEEADEVIGWLEYNADLFDETTVERMARHFELLLRKVVADPERRLADLPLLSDAERHQLLYEWNDRRSEYPSQCLHELFEAQVGRTPDNTAFVFAEERLSYRELNERANQLAHYLQRLGVGPESLVGILMERSVEMIVSVLGVLKAGAAYVPLDPEYPRERLAFMLEDARVCVVLTQERWRSVVGELGPAVVCVESDWRVIQEQETANPQSGVNATNLAYVIYTSGSTGTPNGVLIEHHNIANLITEARSIFAVSEESRVLSVSSFSFDASVLEMFLALTSGARLYLSSAEERLSIEELQELIEREQLMTAVLTPTWLQALAEERCGSLRVVSSGAERLSAAQARRWARGGRRLLNCYGPTEATVFGTYQEQSEASAASDLSRSEPGIGRGLGNVRVYVLDEQQQVVPVGVSGELYLGGAGVGRGYLSRADLTASRYVPDPYSGESGARMYRTGDVARWRAEGELEYVGRRDEQVKVRGQRVELGEVEAALREQEGVRECVVVAQESGTGEQRLLAYVVAEQESHAFPSERVELCPSVAEYFVYDDYLYQTLTHDEKRNQKYRAVIDRCVKDRVVLDIGTGRDAILARLCVEAGARRVYAVEVLEESYRQAREQVRSLGLEARIIVLHGDSRKISLPESVDVCVSEIVGSIGGSEGAALILNDARRFLTGDGVMIPERSVTRVAAVSLPEAVVENPGFSELSAHYTEQIFAEVGHRFDLRLCIRNFPRSGLLSESGVFEELDFRNSVEATYRRELELQINRKGRCDGLLVWMELEVGAGEVIDILERGYSWYPVYFPIFDRGVEVDEGDRIVGECGGRVSGNGINPDYWITGKVVRKDGGEEEFEYESKHQGEGYRERGLYRELFDADGRIKRREERVVTSQGLREQLKQRLPEFMIPAHFVLLKALPLTPSGKIDRHALPRPDSSVMADGHSSPRNPVEELIAGIWSELLDVRHVSVEESFFDLGGHSLLATQVISRVREVFKVDIPLQEMFEEPTVAKLASRVEAEMNGGRSLQAEPIRRSEREGELPLSFAQQRLWFLDQFEPGNPVYNISIPLRLTGSLHHSALQQTFTEIVRRHESLRTTFPTHDGQPVHLIAAPYEFALPTSDLSGLPQDLREAEATRLTNDEAQQPFDLAIGPLLRTRLLRLADEEHLLLFTMHHIVSDGWSMNVLIKEVTALYAAFSQGKASPLPELPIQYADYAAWQRERLSGPVLEEQLQYWREELEGAPPALELPTMRERSAAQSNRGAGHTLTLAAPLTDELRKLSRQHGTTLFMTLLAAFQALLHRYTGQDDVVVGTPIANRNRAETEELIGFFLNTLALRVRLGGNPTFGELLKQVREVCIGAYAHQDVPFEKIIEELQPERDLDRTPVFQVMFNMLNLDYDGRQIDLEGLKVVVPPTEEAFGSKFDLTLYAREQNGEIQLQLIYSDLFTPAATQRMLDHLHTLLRAVTSDPEQRLASLPLLTEDEREQRSKLRNRVQPSNAFVAFAKEEIEQTIQERFEKQARSYPENIAVKTREQTWTYEELNRRANQIARALLAQCGNGEQRIALFFNHDAPLVAGILGVLKAGKTYVPLDTAYPEQRLKQVLNDSEPAALLTNNTNLHKALEGIVPVINIDDIDPNTPVDNLELQCAPDTLAYILYTSGSTGQPKGVVQNHRNVLHHISSYTNNLHICADDKLTLLSSYAFDAAVMDIFGALLNGATLCPIDLRDEELAVLSDRLTEEEITIYHSTPTVYRYFINGLRDEETFPKIRLVVLGGEEVHRRDFELYRKHFSPLCLFINGFGPTESTVSLQYFADNQTSITHNSIPIGFPVENTEVSLFNKAGEQAAIYGVGEIVVSSPHLALGYWRRPELTEAAFLSALDNHIRRYRTGDLGRWLEDGTIEYVGRKDDQVKVRGHRIELGEVEAALSGCRGVKECVVVVVRDLGGNAERLVAYVVTEEAVSSSEWRRQLGERLPEYMIPAMFVKLDQMPLTTNGKVDRRALPEVEAQRPELDQEYEGPQTAAEELLCGIWSEVLRVERVGIHDNFFELGGHSLLATQAIAHIRQLFPVEIALRSIFEFPTIAGLAQLIESEMGARQQVQAPAIERLFGVRRHDAALLSVTVDRGQSGVKPPHSKEAPNVKREAELPLSFAQQRLWFLDQLSPNNAAYNIPAAVRIDGPLNLAALEQAINTIVERHESLRTTFHLVDGEPMQKISAPQKVSVRVVDLREVMQIEGEAAASRHAAEESGKPFDLSRGPLLRVAVLRLEEQQNVVLLTMHHIISDGWSIGVLIRELATLYEAFAAEKSPALPALPIQYADYANWQRQWLSGATLDAHLAYWREKLDGHTPVLNLPTDHPRPAAQTFNGARVSQQLPRTLVQELKKLCGEEKVTMFMALLATFKILLYRYTNQPDIIVGSPIANRGGKQLESLIGFFANTLVLRTDLSGEPEFRELLERVRETALGAYTHQDLPFEKLVDELHVARDLNYTPLFQVMFTFQNAPLDEIQISDLTLSFLETESGTAKFDLELLMTEKNGELFAAWEYNTDLFERSTIERMARHFQNLLTDALINPQQKISTLQLLSDEERQQLLVDWTNTRADFDLERCAHHLFEEQAARAPDALAVFCESESLTYAELNARANRLAATLVEHGVGPDVLVALLSARDINLLTAILAVFKAGGAYVPLDPFHPAARLRQVLQQSRSRLLLTTKEFAPEFSEEMEGAPLVLLIEDLLREKRPDRNLPSRSAGGNLAYVIYTSGSTGVPKGAMVEHRGMLNHLYAKISDLQLTERDTIAQTASQCFDISVWQFLAALVVGGTVHIFTDEIAHDGSRLLDETTRHSISILETVPSLLRVSLDQPVRGGLSSLRYMVVTGETLPPELCRAWFNHYPSVPLMNAYGPTECSDDVTHYFLTHAPSADVLRVPIGRAVINMRLYVLDARHQPVSVGVSGELYVGGVGVGRGYLNDAARTAEVFIPDSFAREPGARLYKTGDLGRYLPDGSIEFQARVDHQVKVRGFRIELGEIEAALRSLPDVAEAVVLVRRDARGIQQLVAYVVTEEAEMRVSSSQWRRQLGERLPEYMIPAMFVKLEEMPLTANGKVDRRALPEVEARRPELDQVYEGPRTAAEELLCGIWSEVLGVERIGIHDNFFELGGDSIMSLQIISKVNQAGLQLTPRDLFMHQSVAELAAVASSSRLMTMDQGVVIGEVPLTPIQRWFFEAQPVEPDHFSQSVLLKLQAGADHALIERAVQQLFEHHDALRLRFVPHEAGWRQFNAGLEGAVPFDLEDLSRLSDDEQRSAIELIATEAQRSLRLTESPVARVILFDCGIDKEARLLIVIHRLTVDSMSWRILLEDLQTAYEQLKRGEALKLPRKTTSYKQWAERLALYVDSDSLSKEAAYWLDDRRGQVTRLQTDHQTGSNLVGSTRKVFASLDAQETRALLHEVPAAYRTTVDDALLTALAQTFARWSGERRLLVNVETHGREEFVEDVNVSRTVGWFTTIFPVLLEWGETRDVGEMLKSVKEQLHAVPQHGIGYGLLRYLRNDVLSAKLRELPPAEVVFNYSGQLDSVLAGSKLLRAADELSAQSGKEIRRHVLEINADISDGRLQMTWSYSENLHQRATIECLAAEYLNALREVMKHCQSPEASGFTPADFPEARLSQKELDKILGKFKATG